MNLYSALLRIKDNAHDPIAWREQLVALLLTTYRAKFALCLELAPCSTPRFIYFKGAESDIQATCGQSELINWLDSSLKPVSTGVPLLRLTRHLESMCDYGVACDSFWPQGLVDSVSWAKSPDYQFLCEKLGAATVLYSGLRLATLQSKFLVTLIGFSTPFDNGSIPPDVETHNSFLRTIGQSIGKGLATLEAPSMSKLPPRRRQTLEKILLGLSDEEIAVELGLSKDTVRGHIKELFRDFHVSSRAELMAHVLRYSRSLPEDLY